MNLPTGVRLTTNMRCGKGTGALAIIGGPMDAGSGLGMPAVIGGGVVSGRAMAGCGVSPVPGVSGACHSDNRNPRRCALQPDELHQGIVVSEMLGGGRYLYPVLMGWFVAGIILLLRTFPDQPPDAAAGHLLDIKFDFWRFFPLSFPRSILRQKP
jgi:hypothetical protein